MIIVELVGGLGNQMFQYATARALAERHNAELRLDISHFSGMQRPDALSQFPRAFKLAQFNISGSIASPADVARVRDWLPSRGWVGRVVHGVRRKFPMFPLGWFKERTANVDPVVRRLPDNAYLSGYFQCDAYFRDAAHLIRQEFTPTDSKLTEYARSYVRERRIAGRPIVAVHVRRGDLAYSVEVARDPKLVYGPPVTLEYIRAAQATFAAERPVFLVFSDSTKDLDWCRERLIGADTHFCYGHNDLQDFAVMQACDHQIISNSTFSWWAAWLNPNRQKRVVAPRAWYYPETRPGFRMRSLIPQSWTLL